MGILALAYKIQKHSPTIQLRPSIIHKTENRDQYQSLSLYSKEEVNNIEDILQAQNAAYKDEKKNRLVRGLIEMVAVFLSVSYALCPLLHRS